VHADLKTPLYLKINFSLLAPNMQNFASSLENTPPAVEPPGWMRELRGQLTELESWRQMAALFDSEVERRLNEIGYRAPFFFFFFFFFFFPNLDP
jgi:hypothetical protein